MIEKIFGANCKVEFIPNPNGHEFEVKMTNNQGNVTGLFVSISCQCNREILTNTEVGLGITLMTLLNKITTK